MNTRARRLIWIWGATLLLVVVAEPGRGLPAGEVQAATLYVANNGTDGSTCGALSSPCRSIGQAISNAAAGDTIIVGPGRYGNLDGNVAFGSVPGEEAAPAGCVCMILVDKKLTIVSSAGAGATVLDAGGAPVSVVAIIDTASETVFGQPEKGFTLTGAASFLSTGLVIGSATSGVRVAGNIARDNPFHGFSVRGSAHLITGNLAVSNGRAGFLILGPAHVVSANVATGNGGAGFTIGGDTAVVTGNTASDNGNDGFALSGTGLTVKDNAASGNGIYGFALRTDSSGTFTGNAIHDNRLYGVQVSSTGMTISGNNIFGNGPSGNCGLYNATGTTITAPNNFWGNPNGLGPADPADSLCPTAPPTWMGTPRPPSRSR